MTKNSLKGVPSMCCKWFICKSRHTREKSSQIMCGKGFVASCHASINCLTLSKNSQICLCNAMWLVFQTGEQNLEKVTIQNIGSYLLTLFLISWYPGPLSAESIQGCSTMHKASVSDFLILIFAPEI